jgi:hypothetical protein
MDSYLEGSLTKKQANYGIWKGFEEEFEEEFEKARRCTYMFCTIAYSELDWSLLRCSPSEKGKTQKTPGGDRHASRCYPPRNI